MKSAKLLTASAALALLLFTVACDIKTSVDYDRNADFSSYKTYAWFDPENPEISDLNHRRILAAVDSNLAAKGLQKADSDPDLYVTYFGDEDEQTVIDTNHYGYGYGAGWYWGGGMGMASSTSTVRSYTKGTLVVDMYDASKKELVWRGAISGTVSDNPQTNEKNINKGFAKLFKQYPPEIKG
jgi:hypothetical protein